MSVNIEDLGLVHSYPFVCLKIFLSGLACCPHVSGKNSHHKRILTKQNKKIILSSVLLYSRGRIKTEGFEKDDGFDKFSLILFVNKLMIGCS